MSIVTLKIIFFTSLFIVFYAYLGYGILLFILIRIKNFFFKKENKFDYEFLPEVTFMVAAFNEEVCINEKIKNSFEFEYPKNKIKFFFVTDGSNDRTPDIVKNYPNPEGFDLQLFHQP